MINNLSNRFCAISGVICVSLFFLGFVCAGFVPPLSPSMTQDDVYAYYQIHHTGIKLGAICIILSSMFYASFTAIMSSQMHRIEGVSLTLIYAQLAAGAFACLTFLVPGIFFAVSAFRVDRSPELIYLMNDLSWIMLVIPWPPFMIQNFAFGLAILSDKRDEPLFPRWLGYLNFWAPISFTPGILLPFFKSGPFAWNGILVIWIPAFIFIVWFIAASMKLLTALKRQDIPQV